MTNKVFNLPEKILQLKDYQGDDRVIDSAEMSSLLDSKMSIPVFWSKFPLIDKYLQGFAAGELITVSGLPKSGKTLFCMTLTKNFITQDIRSLWFQYENLPEIFIRGFGDTPPLFVLPQKLKAYSLEWIKERIVEAIAKFGIKVVFIDHLHFLFELVMRGNMSLQIGSVVRFLKHDIAKELNITVILLCHLRNVPYDQEPGYIHLRDSSLIASEGDCVMILWRLKKEADETCTKAMLKIEFSRRSGCWYEKIKIIKQGFYLHEFTEKDKWSL